MLLSIYAIMCFHFMITDLVVIYLFLNFELQNWVSKLCFECSLSLQNES